MSFDKRYSLGKIGDTAVFPKNGQNLVLSKKFRSNFVQLCQPGSRPVVHSPQRVVLPQQGYRVGIKEQESGTDATTVRKSLQREPPSGEGILTQRAVPWAFSFVSSVLPRGKIWNETRSVCGRSAVLARLSGEEATDASRGYSSLPRPFLRSGWAGLSSWSLLQKQRC